MARYPTLTPTPTLHLASPTTLTSAPTLGGQHHCISIDTALDIVCDPGLGYTSLSGFLQHEAHTFASIVTMYRIVFRTTKKRRR